MTFLHDFSKTLTAGKFAVLAEIDETWTDTRRYAAAEVRRRFAFRRLRGEVVADQLVREREALDANMKALNDDLKQAASENRAAIQQDIERVKKQIKAIQEQAKARLDQAKAETEARVKALRDQAKAATGRAKTQIEKRYCRRSRRTSKCARRSSARRGR